MLWRLPFFRLPVLTVQIIRNYQLYVYIRIYNIWLLYYNIITYDNVIHSSSWSCPPSCEIWTVPIIPQESGPRYSRCDIAALLVITKWLDDHSWSTHLEYHSMYLGGFQSKICISHSLTHSTVEVHNFEQRDRMVFGGSRRSSPLRKVNGWKFGKRISRDGTRIKTLQAVDR